MLFLSNLSTFCIISFTDGVNLATYCENLKEYCVRLCENDEINRMGEKQEIFIGLITFQTIAALLLQISKCRELSDFGLIFLPQKLRSLRFFFTNIQSTSGVPKYS